MGMAPVRLRRLASLLSSWIGADSFIETSNIGLEETVPSCVSDPNKRFRNVSEKAQHNGAFPMKGGGADPALPHKIAHMRWWA